MVTVAEIARNIGIPATTAREYVGRFKTFFPTKKVTGKRYPMHPETSEDVMRDIVDGYGKNLTTDDITNTLKEKYPMSADVIDDDSQDKQLTNGHTANNTTSSALADNSTLQLISQMNSMQMQLMQKMTEVLDRNNQVMERVISAIEKNSPSSQQRVALRSPLPITPSATMNTFSSSGGENNNHTEQKLPPPPPKKFIMPSKEELEKRKKQGWLGRMFGK